MPIQHTTTSNKASGARIQVAGFLLVVALSTTSCWVSERDLGGWSAPDGCERQVWYRDLDEDGYGTGERTLACDPVVGRVANDGDCDDDDWTIHPDGIELPGNGIDEDCDGTDALPDELTGVFVATIGSPDAMGTRDDPLSTLKAAIDLALATERVVYVSGGTYAVTTQLYVPVSIHGSFDSGTWTRDSESPPTVIDHQASYYAFSVDSESGETLVLSALRFEATTQPTLYVPEGVTLAAFDSVFSGGNTSTILVNKGAFLAVRSTFEACYLSASNESHFELYRDQFRYSTAVVCSTYCRIVQSELEGVWLRQ